ncbi:MAG: hypothetical protein ACKVVP_20860 [Chloroflexota bacterium]
MLARLGTIAEPLGSSVVDELLTTIFRTVYCQYGAPSPVFRTLEWGELPLADMPSESVMHEKLGMLFDPVPRKEQGMAKLRILSARGDTVVEWDEQRLEAGDPEAMAAIQEAERIFDDQRARGATAFRVAPERPAERIDEFDPSAREIIMVPRVAGG